LADGRQALTHNKQHDVVTDVAGSLQPLTYQVHKTMAANSAYLSLSKQALARRRAGGAAKGG